MNARPETRDEVIARWVAERAAEAPPLTASQAARLGQLLTGGGAR